MTDLATIFSFSTPSACDEITAIKSMNVRAENQNKDQLLEERSDGKGFVIVYRFNLFYFIIACYLLVNCNTKALDIQLQDVLEGSKIAMSLVTEYELLNSGNKSKIYQKKNTNGVITTRSEVIVGKTTRITITIGDQSILLFPEKHLAIDQSAIVTSMSTQLQQAGTRSFASLIENSAASVTTISGVVKNDDRMCYNIKCKVATDLIANLTKSISPDFKGFIADEVDYLIDTNTLYIVEFRSLQHGVIIGRTEFKGFKTNSLPDDLFSVPAGYVVESANNEDDYALLISKYFSRKPRLLPGYAIDPKTQLVVKVDPKTGAYIPLGDPKAVANSVSSTAIRYKRIRLSIIIAMTGITIAFLFAIIKWKKKIT